MAIGYRGAGALATTTTNSLTFTLPAGLQSGDLIILHIGAGEDSPEPAYVSGLTGYQLRGSKLYLDYGPGSVTQWIYWKIAGSSESNPSITINDGGGGLWGYAMAFSGVSPSSPFDLASVSQGTNTSAVTFTPPSVDTQTPGAWVVSLVQTSDNNVLALNTAQSFTLRVGGASYGTDVGLDASFGAATREIASPTTVTLPTWEQTAVSPDYWGYQTVGLTPDGPIPRSGSFTANAIARKARTGSITANAVVKASSGTKTFTADAATRLHIEDSISADAVLFDTMQDSLAADAIALRGSEDNISADASFVLTSQDSLAADAVLRSVEQGSVASDAVVLATMPGSFTADALVEYYFRADAYIKGGAIEGSFTADAVISLVGKCIWVSPENLTGMTATPTLVFLMPQASGDMHFQIELDTDSGFSAPTVAQSPGTGWEYWDGDSWEPIPDSGVPNTYSGNEARYTVQTPLSQATWYRRVRAGVIS